MKYPSWKVILNESTPLITYSGVKVFNTNHSLERAIERHPEITLEDFKIIFKRAIDSLTSRNAFQYLIFSKEYNFGIVVDFRQDKFANDDSNHFFIVTVLPKGKQNVVGTTRKMLIEVHSTLTIDSDLVNYLEEIFSITINEAEDSIEMISKEGINFVFVDRKLYDIDKMFIQIK